MSRPDSLSQEGYRSEAWRNFQSETLKETDSDSQHSCTSTFAFSRVFLAFLTSSIVWMWFQEKEVIYSSQGVACCPSPVPSPLFTPNSLVWDALVNQRTCPEYIKPGASPKVGSRPELLSRPPRVIIAKARDILGRKACLSWCQRESAVMLCQHGESRTAACYRSVLCLGSESNLA